MTETRKSTFDISKTNEHPVYFSSRYCLTSHPHYTTSDTLRRGGDYNGYKIYIIVMIIYHKILMGNPIIFNPT